MNHQALNNVLHKDLKILTERSSALGDNQALAQIFPVEFSQLQGDFPLLLKRNNNDDGFEFIALMGFDKGENLYLNNNQWLASSTPLSMQKGPFLIGFEMQMANGVPTQTPVLHIDLDNPRVNKEQGEALFLEHGGNTAYLEQMNSVLNAIYRGQEHAQHLVQQLEQYDLIEPLNINITLNNGSTKNLTGLYTIHEDNLANLPAAALETLHQNGYLANIYMLLASLVNIKKLVNYKNQQS